MLRSLITAAAAITLGFGALTANPLHAFACSATQTDDFGGSTVCSDSSPAEEAKPAKIGPSSGPARARNNPVDGNYRLPTNQEFAKAMKRAYKDADRMKDYKLATEEAGFSDLGAAPGGVCVGGSGYRWSGSAFVATNQCVLVSVVGGGSGGDPVVQQFSPEQAARSVIARLNFTATAPGIGPDHDDNHLADDRTGAAFDAPVGYPLWLYADGGTIEPRTVTATAGGMSVRISIKVDSISWSMGDGHSKTCGVGTKWRKGAVEPATPSPTCGYVYEKRGRYTVTATTHWTISWAAGGQTGTIPFAIGRDRLYRVGELQTIIR
jgi:hypothetical protein